MLKLINIVKSETIDLSLKKSALEQLVILLQGIMSPHPFTKVNFTYQVSSLSSPPDDCLHQRALEDGLVDHLITTLKSILSQMDQYPGLRQPSNSQGESYKGGGELVCLLSPCLSCLLVLTTFNHAVRGMLRENYRFLVTVFLGEC